MTTWKIDPAHTTIGFKVKHLMVSTVQGMFTTFEGTVTADDDLFTNAKITFSADVESISTNNAQRDGHLKSGDFFDAEHFPKISFVSKMFTKKDSGNYEVLGDLTMKGVTKELVLNATLNGMAKGMDGKRVAAFDVSGKINRIAFGVSWNAPVETGGVVVGEDVMLSAAVELKEE